MWSTWNQPCVQESLVDNTQYDKNNNYNDAKLQLYKLNWPLGQIS